MRVHEANYFTGCVFSPLRHSSLSSPEEIAYDLDTIRPKLLVLHHSETKTLTTAKNAGIPNILVFSPEKESDIPTGIRTLDEALLSSNELAKPYAYTKDEVLNTPCCLYFTSGSTGRRKAVMLSQNALVSILLYNTTPLSPAINHLAPNTFSFASSLVTCLIFTVYFGMSVYIMDKKQQTLADICETVEKYQISLLSLAPYMVYGLVKEPEMTKKYSLSSVKIVGVGGSSLDKSMISFAKQNMGLVLINFFGMTECMGVFSNNPDWTLMGSVGCPGLRSSLRIVSDDGKDLPAGQMGELRVKGPAMTLGYYRNPEATAELFDEQGYMKTGDICKVDENGLFYHVTRLKDLIKYKSNHIYPIEIERILITHPSVSDCAVVGVYSKDEGTEHPRAYVTLVNHTTANDKLLQEIQEYTDSQLPENKRLRGGVVELDEFPRTGSGKIQRFELRQWANKDL
ncbi:unnamed protein product [Rhizopus stolonifer]